MKSILALILLFSLALTQSASAQEPAPEEYVILLHGLARSKSTMKKMAKQLQREGYGVLNIQYPSRKKTVQELSAENLPDAIAACRDQGAKKIHFVTHSMGGILVRYYLHDHNVPELGRVVMLSPPNQGSELVDKLGWIFLFHWINGPAGQQLGTHADDLPQQLGPADFELGVITGDRSINWINSMLIPGKDDGKVSIQRAQLDGMRDFIVIHSSHPFIMKKSKAIRQTIAFLRNGCFEHPEK
ncbi:alpha/beta fold hydrolase [Candidatus Sumerlaeota bacterium]|nr:alpha/beta fold hydrolase [Candidatus Sumerlaeota bacterium]